jgi:hypothetical protein
MVRQRCHRARSAGIRARPPIASGCADIPTLAGTALEGCAGQFMPTRIPGRIAVLGGTPSMATRANTPTALEFPPFVCTCRKVDAFLPRPGARREGKLLPQIRSKTTKPTPKRGSEQSGRPDLNLGSPGASASTVATSAATSRSAISSVASRVPRPPRPPFPEARLQLPRTIQPKSRNSQTTTPTTDRLAPILLPR